jgi:hypothetical protein
VNKTGEHHDIILQVPAETGRVTATHFKLQTSERNRATCKVAFGVAVPVDAGHKLSDDNHDG